MTGGKDLKCHMKDGPGSRILYILRGYRLYEHELSSPLTLGVSLVSLPLFRKTGRRSRVKPRALPLLAIIEFRMEGRDHKNDSNTLFPNIKYGCDVLIRESNRNLE